MSTRLRLSQRARQLRRSVPTSVKRRLSYTPAPTALSVPRTTTDTTATAPVIVNVHCDCHKKDCPPSCGPIYDYNGYPYDVVYGTGCCNTNGCRGYGGIPTPVYMPSYPYPYPYTYPSAPFAPTYPPYY